MITGQRAERQEAGRLQEGPGEEEPRADRRLRTDFGGQAGHRARENEGGVAHGQGVADPGIELNEHGRIRQRNGLAVQIVPDALGLRAHVSIEGIARIDSLHLKQPDRVRPAIEDHRGERRHAGTGAVGGPQRVQHGIE